MTEGNLQLLEILTYWVLVAPAVTVLLVSDERRLRPDQAARAWPPVSRDAALFVMWMLGFHPAYVLLVLAVHFVRTRGVIRGLVLAFVWACAVLAPGVAAVYGLDALFGSGD